MQQLLLLAVVVSCVYCYFLLFFFWPTFRKTSRKQLAERNQIFSCPSVFGLISENEAENAFLAVGLHALLNRHFASVPTFATSATFAVKVAVRLLSFAKVI
ncbi:hypothetical protein [Rufibacter quisquiliarum]|uniref:Putative membrane protein n=1 Tax=Rufibacter quisquiliarum TaxID=1549639 RepID=A0A839GPF4_9BACT|nr:hypothetical protein [Rufibacter quisquiliarum]MBA9079863.1 putative membrane protein [Rufibacter quisquiliarum]